jgi:hypothetical protein
MRCQAAQIPFLFLTAYSRESIPAELRDRPFIQKPHVPRDLVDRLASLLSPGEAGVETRDRRRAG